MVNKETKDANALSTAGGNEFLTPKEVAVELHLHPGSIYRKISEGTLPAVRLGGPRSALRIPVDEFQGWLYEPEAPR
jgi:excisionase family DNA binding protein